MLTAIEVHTSVCVCVLKGGISNSESLDYLQVKDGTKLFEFRRGVKRCVSIVSLSFSTCSNYLCCSSNTETVHIFKLERTPPATSKDNAPQNSDWMG